jgi:hypothetical protein
MKPSSHAVFEFFQDLGSRKIVADSNAGALGSVGGLLHLRQVDAGAGISRLIPGFFKNNFFQKLDSGKRCLRKQR